MMDSLGVKGPFSKTEFLCNEVKDGKNNFFFKKVSQDIWTIKIVFHCRAYWYFQPYSLSPNPTTILIFLSEPDSSQMQLM